MLRIETILRNADMLRKRKIGVALCGSFANVPFGAFALRTILQRFRALSIPIEVYAGDSAGCFAAAAAACGYEELCAACTRILELTPRTIYDFHPISLMLHPFSRASILDDDPLRRFVRGIVNPEKLFNRDRPGFAKLEIMTTDLESGDLIVCTNYPPPADEPGVRFHHIANRLEDIEMASKALVPFFKPQELEGMRLADGGFRNNCPVDRAVAHGCDLVLVFDVYGVKIHSQRQRDSWLVNLDRAVNIMIAAASEQRLKYIDKVNSELAAIGTYCAQLREEGNEHEAERLSAHFTRVLGLEDKRPVAYHIVSAQAPIRHIDFNKFSEHDLRGLAGVAYYAAKLELVRLGIDDGIE